MKLPVYLDNHATTRVDPRVLEEMLPYFGDRWGNAASRQHEYGWVAEGAVEASRARVAALIGSRADEIVFTSGATESINLALKGVAEAYASQGTHIVTAATEHQAVLDTVHRLERGGFRVTLLPVDRFGCVSPDQVADALVPETVLVSIMLANNEIGTVAPVAEIGRLCRERGVLFHTDATQAVGKIPVDVEAMNIDLMSFSAHKMYGPKGVGALFIREARPRILLEAQIDGGGHERGLRSGTLNVPGIVGFGKAAELARQELVPDAAHTRALRDKLVNVLREGLEGISVNGHPEQRLPHNASITFAGVKADAILMGTKDVAVSSGSACSSASPEPSHVLSAIGLSVQDVRSSLRFGLGRFTTEEEIDYASSRLIETVKGLRERSYVMAG